MKTLSLAITDSHFRFLPGQWVDFFACIDGQEEVAGYSITSSPLERGSIELAVKNEGANRVTRHLHSRATVGDRVAVAVGGDFWYTRERGNTLVLIAGGIGINPIMSILRYLDAAAPEVRATLVYSVQTPAELLFGDDIRRIEARHPNIQAHFTLTGSPVGSWQGRIGRVDGNMLRSLAPEDGALYYLCGPPAMVADLRRQLVEFGIDSSRIEFESWYAP